MIWKTAWKNVWRNKIRSLVVIGSITIGIFGGAFSVAVMNGAIQQRVEAALTEEISHVHVNDPAFRDNYDIDLSIDGIEKTLETINQIPGIEAVTKRVVISGMANTATKSAGVQIIGINPEEEKSVFDLYETTIAGTGDYFDRETRYNLAYIGHDLAKELNIIRFIINESTIDSLIAKGLPLETIDKISGFIGFRFKSEKSFKKEMQKVLSMKEENEYGRIIKDEAWSFRERSKMTLTFLDKDQMQTGAIFRIAGIYDIKNSMYELGHVFVKNEDLMNLTGMSANEYHQLIIKIDDLENTKQISESIAAKLPDLEVMNWKEIAPDLAMMTDMMQQFYAIFMFIILAALAFGIVNTMLMIVLERTKELGMLTAIGMNKRKVFNMIMLESVFLSLIGGVVGMIVSRVLIQFTATNGINFYKYSEGFEAMGYSAHIYPVITPGFFFMVTILIIITGILSSIYPALKALKLDPAEALRTE